jgi:hypothetical protein
MELKDFVADALFQIQAGVEEACRRNTIGVTSPAFRLGGQDVNWPELVRSVEFDIAVEITNKISGRVEGGAKVLAVLNLTGKGEAFHERNDLNKVKFAVPIIYPANVIAITVVGENKIT